MKEKFQQDKDKETIVETSKESSNSKIGATITTQNSKKSSDLRSKSKAKFGNEVGVREWLENLCINQLEEMISKRYSKYVLFRIVVGGIYSKEFPENQGDSDDTMEIKKKKIKERNAVFSFKILKKFFKRNEINQRGFLRDSVLQTKDTCLIF